MKPPVRKELVGPGHLTLDEKTILKNFLGITSDEAIELFNSSPSVAEDFMWMAEPGLKYYIPPVIAYLKSADSKDDWEFAHGIMCSLSFQVGHNKLSESTIKLIKKAAIYLDNNKYKYDIKDDKQFNEYIQIIYSA